MRRVYGAGPLHLAGALASFAVAAYALIELLGLVSRPGRVLAWLGGSIVAHDLVLFPLYALLGVLASGLLLRRRDRLHVAVLNHLRAPALVSGLLLLVWFPLVSERAPRTFMRLTSLSADVYLDRWLALAAALFAGSLLVLALRLPRLRRET